LTGPNEHPDNEATAAPDEAAATPETEQGAATDDPEAGTVAASDPVDQVTDLKDQLLRALAETENVRRRAQREREDAAKYAIAGFARDMLPLGDNLARVLDAVPAEAREADGPLRTFLEGIALTQREVLAAFERHGIRRLDPMGEKFDHNFHQAMFEVESADAVPGTVVQVAQAGYVIGDRLLRPAMVGVAKAPASAAEDAPDDDPGGQVDTRA
jgi:molecular chaperone GrpE